MSVLDNIFKGRKRREQEIMGTLVDNAVSYIDQMISYRKYTYIMLGREEGQWINIRDWKNAIEKGRWRIDDHLFLDIVDQFEKAGCLKTDRPFDPTNFQMPQFGLLLPVSNKPLQYSNKVKVTAIGRDIFALISVAGSGVWRQMNLPQHWIDAALQWDKEMNEELGI